MRLHLKRIFRVCYGIGSAFIITLLFFKMIVPDISTFIQSEQRDQIVTAKPRNISAKEGTSNSVPNTRFPSMLTDGHTVHRRFVEMKYGPVYIFGAAAGNSSRYATWDIIKIYGGVDKSWYNKSHFHFRCCLSYNDHGSLTFKKVFPSKTRGFIVSSAIWSVHVTCFNTRHEEKMVPIGAALTVTGYNCSRNHVRYVSPYFPLREATEKVAIGTKTSYGNIRAELIIEWMESWRYIGVDKIVAYYIQSLNDDALRVLQYYAATGILDLYFYEPAASDKYPRDTYGDHFQRQNDQQIVVDDSFERMSGYRYFGIFDFDEFLTLGEGTTIHETMTSLYRMFPNATGVTFLSHYFFLSWGRSSNISDLVLGSYAQSTKPKFDNYKSLYMPERVAFGGADTHTIKSKTGYEMYRKKYPCFGLVHHYRSCRKEKMPACMTGYERLADTSIATWSLRFYKNVLAVREAVFGSIDVP